VNLLADTIAEKGKEIRAIILGLSSRGLNELQTSAQSATTLVALLENQLRLFIVGSN
jgi:hypothetical protein